jgi:phage terminase large subunit-like protein
VEPARSMSYSKLLEPAFQYASSVTRGDTKACEDVKLAAQRFLDMAERRDAPYEFIAAKAEHILKFVKFCKHVKGPDAGKPIELQPFQIMFLAGIYGFREKGDNSKRWVTDVILFVPRKSGKTTLASIIALYELQFGDAGPEVFTLATSREQASICFDSSKAIVEGMAPELKSRYTTFRAEIKKSGDTTSTYRALSRENRKTGDGKNPSVALIDEAAQIIERGNIEVLHSGMGARKNPLRLYMTTASFTKDTKFYEDLTHFRAVLRGAAADTFRWFGLLYSIDAGDQWTDESTWGKANPMLGVSVTTEHIRHMADEAQSKPASLNEFLCKQLNVYVSAHSAWVDRRNWDESVGNDLGKEREATFIAFDLAHSRDLNAICTLHRYAEEDLYARFQFFLPEDSFQYIPNHYKGIFQEAIRSGILRLTQGNVTDLNEIESYICQQAEKYEIKEIGFDPYNAASLVANLYNKGLPVKKVGQGMAALSNPSKTTEQLIMKKAIKHDGNPFVGWQLGNCEVFTDVNGNVKVRKNEADPAAKVDGIISLIMAIHCHLDNTFVSNSYGIRLF